jgi:hypothetical protein
MSSRDGTRPAPAVMKVDTTAANAAHEGSTAVPSPEPSPAPSPRAAASVKAGDAANGPVAWRDLPRKDQLAVITLARVSEPLVQTSLQVREPIFSVPVSASVLASTSCFLVPCS